MAPLVLNGKGVLYAGLLCVAAALGEALCAGKRPNATLRSLKLPSWAAPTPVWFLIGLAYYTACFLSLYRVSAAAGARLRILTLTLIVAVMATNAAWNFVFFRRHDWQMSFWYLLPYSALVVAMVYTLSRVDGLSALFFVVYLMYLPYAFAWTYRIWKLNA
jgi:tryptophan-rich sensory protein